MKTIILLFLISISSFSFDHTHKEFNELLKTNVSFEGNQSLVNYQGFIKEKPKFEKYLNKLSGVNKELYNKWRKSKKLTFLINSYNAFTIKLIIDNYPTKSIKDLGGFFSSPWKKEFISLLGKKVTLDNIEHDMIRKDFDEPRIHFAVNCASIGCPSLLNEAFTFNQIEQQLEKATKLFLNDKSKNYIKDNKIYLSKIFKWYGEDFNSKHGSFINFVSKYLKTINPKKDNDVEWTSYNWDLNDLKE